jgi:hypothetical protein
MAGKPGTTLLSGTTEVPTEQTPVRLTTTGQKFTAVGVWVGLDPSSVGAQAAVGDKNVNAKKTLGTTKGILLEKKQPPLFIECDDPAELWVDCEKGKDFVIWTAVLA